MIADFRLQGVIVSVRVCATVKTTTRLTQLRQLGVSSLRGEGELRGDDAEMRVRFLPLFGRDVLRSLDNGLDFHL